MIDKTRVFCKHLNMHLNMPALTGMRNIVNVCVFRFVPLYWTFDKFSIISSVSPTQRLLR
jgi:hypothetical protein